MKRGLRVQKSKSWWSAAVVLSLAFVFACTSDERFQQRSISDLYAQDYNPEYLDVLWVVDNRSPMRFVAPQLTDEAARFFRRLDGSASQYRMAVITMDMLVAQGRLQPLDAPVLFQRNVGTLEQRVQNFRAVFPLSLNLRTGAEAKGFESAMISLRNYFQPRANTPLVVVFVSDSEDSSFVPTGNDAISFYRTELLGLKGDNADLVRVYSINYPTPLPASQRNSTTRCTNEGNADIDKPGYTGKFFALANAMGGTTANLCGSFSDEIDLSGLKLRELPSRFTLTNQPDMSTLRVSVYFANKAAVPGMEWTYDAAANQIVFKTAPPEGSTVEVTYLANNPNK